MVALKNRKLRADIDITTSIILNNLIKKKSEKTLLKMLLHAIIVLKTLHLKSKELKSTHMYSIIVNKNN